MTQWIDNIGFVLWQKASLVIKTWLHLLSDYTKTTLYYSNDRARGLSTTLYGKLTLLFLRVASRPSEYLSSYTRKAHVLYSLWVFWTHPLELRIIGGETANPVCHQRSTYQSITANQFEITHTKYFTIVHCEENMTIYQVHSLNTFYSDTYMSKKLTRPTRNYGLVTSTASQIPRLWFTVSLLSENIIKTH